MTKSLLSFSRYFAIALVPASLIATLSALSVSAKIVEEYPEEYSQNYLQECQETAIANKRSETDSAASDALIEVGELCFEEILFE